VSLLEVQIDGNRLVAFDGQVLEVFGGSVRRFHVKLLTVTVSRPDKRGAREITLTQAGTNAALPLDEPATFRPILEALQNAGVKVATT
jgi:hypothetical protein